MSVKLIFLLINKVPHSVESDCSKKATESAGVNIYLFDNNTTETPATH
jgi:hypothetical protein